VTKLPEIAQDYTDRNRTSPFAFTGNKFEFRAVGSSQSISWPIAVLNASMAEALDEMGQSIGERMKATSDIKKAAMEVIRQAIIDTKSIRFEGNNYADDWRIEAESRGLPNLRKTPEALAWLVRPESTEFFEKMGIMQPDENEARYHVKLERYLKDVEIEIEMLKDLVHSVVLPAAFKQQTLLSESLRGYVEASKLGGGTAQWARSQTEELETVAGLIADLRGKIEDLEKKATEGSSIDELDKKAKFYAYEVVDSFAEVRKVCDKLEELIDDQIWPLPKYREMLFLS
jgi:glutamine synthetase